MEIECVLKFDEFANHVGTSTGLANIMDAVRLIGSYLIAANLEFKREKSALSANERIRRAFFHVTFAVHPLPEKRYVALAGVVLAKSLKLFLAPGIASSLSFTRKHGGFAERRAVFWPHEFQNMVRNDFHLMRFKS